MVTKILIFTFMFSTFAFSQDKIEVKEKGKKIEVYSVSDGEMVFPASGTPFEMRANQRSARRISPGDRVSEMFSDSPDGGGRIRALPGGIIVKLADGIDAEAWAKDNKLKLIKKLDDQTYLIQSSPGRKSLEELSSIQELEGVESSEPNWWTKMEPKTGIKPIKNKATSYPAR